MGMFISSMAGVSGRHLEIHGNLRSTRRHYAHTISGAVSRGVEGVQPMSLRQTVG